MKNVLKIGLILAIGASSLIEASAQYKLYDQGFESYKAGKFQDAIVSLSEFLNTATRNKAFDVEVYYIREIGRAHV